MRNKKIILILALLICALLLFGCGQPKLDPVPPSGPQGPALEGECGNSICNINENHENCYIDCTNPFGMFNAVKMENDEWNNSYAQELGIENARVNVWRIFVEPSDGVFDFREADELIYSMTDLNINLMITIKNSSTWANTKPYKGASISAFPKDMEKYKKFVRTLVERYKNKVKLWQIENEVFDTSLAPVLFWDGSREEYFEILRAASEVIREEDPQAKVVMNGFGATMIENHELVPGAWEFFEDSMTAAKGYVDIIDYHQYARYDLSELVIPILKEQMQKNGYEAELINTEAGDPDLVLISSYFLYPERDYPIVEELMSYTAVQDKINSVKLFGVTMEEYKDVAYFLKTNPDTGPIVERYQAENTIKRLALTLAQGQKKAFYGVIKDYPRNQSPDWYHIIMGLVDEDGRKKPAFYTYQLLINKTKNFISAEKLMTEPTVVRFNLKGNDFFVAWNKEGSTQVADLSNYFEGENVLVTHIITVNGETEPKTETVNANTITITETPIFIEEI